MKNKPNPNPILKWLKEKLGEEITIELSDGSRMGGILKGFDRHINILLETQLGYVMVRGGSIRRIYQEI